MRRFARFVSRRRGPPRPGAGRGPSVRGPDGAAAAAPAVPSGTPYWPGWDIARAVSITPDGHSGFVLDGFGGLHGFGIGAPKPPVPAGVLVLAGLGHRAWARAARRVERLGARRVRRHPSVRWRARPSNPATPPCYHPGSDFARGIARSCVRARPLRRRPRRRHRARRPRDVRPPAGDAVRRSRSPRDRRRHRHALRRQRRHRARRLGRRCTTSASRAWSRSATLPYWPGWDIARGLAFAARPARVGSSSTATAGCTRSRSATARRSSTRRRS